MRCLGVYASPKESALIFLLSSRMSPRATPPPIPLAQSADASTPPLPPSLLFAVEERCAESGRREKKGDTERESGREKRGSSPGCGSGGRAPPSPAPLGGRVRMCPRGESSLLPCGTGSPSLPGHSTPNCPSRRLLSPGTRRQRLRPPDRTVNTPRDNVLPRPGLLLLAGKPLSLLLTRAPLLKRSFCNPLFKLEYLSNPRLLRRGIKFPSATTRRGVEREREMRGEGA